MTGEKKREDEVSEEELEDVAGGADVFASSRGITLNSSGGKTIGFPDVTGSDAGEPGVPIPNDSSDASSSGNPPGSPSGD